MPPSADPPAGPDLLTDRARDSGRPLAREVARVYTEHYGRPGITARAHFEPDRIVCTVRNPLTADERELVAIGQRRRVIASRQRFERAWRRQLTDVVEARAGRSVSAFLTSDDADPAVEADVFFLCSSPPPGLAVTVQTRDGCTTVVAQGRLDRQTVPALERVTVQELEGCAGELQVDLSRVTFMDPAGMGLVERLKRLETGRARMVSVAFGCRRARRAVQDSSTGIAL